MVHLYNIIFFILVLIFIILPLYIIAFFLVTLIRDLVRDFDNIKLTFGTSTNDNGKTKLELRYWKWEFRKRKYFINYLQNNKTIYLEDNTSFNWTIFYKDVAPFKSKNDKSLLRKAIRIFTE